MSIDWAGWAKLDAALAAVTNYDATPLMADWCAHLIEGNRVGVLKGVDGFGNPMPALKYRTGQGKATRKRRTPDYGTATVASHADGLTSSQYRQLTGPRLAPRREASRIIANLHQEIRAYPEQRRWEAIAAWADVKSDKGYQFLVAHFEGLGRNPKYDLRPVRPETMQFCLNSLQAFARQQLFAHF